jgi:hypothetical protein
MKVMPVTGRVLRLLRSMSKEWITNLVCTTCYRYNLHQVRLLRSMSKEWITLLTWSVIPVPDEGYTCNWSCALDWLYTLLTWSVVTVHNEGYVCNRSFTLDWLSTFLTWSVVAVSDKHGIAFIRYGYYAPCQKSG